MCSLKNHSLLFLLTFLILSASSNAQVFRTLKNFDEIEIGLGPNIFKSHQNASSISMKMGLTGTVNLLYKVKPNFFISARMFYDYTGYSDKFKGLYYDPTIDSTNCKCTVSLGNVETISHTNRTGLSILGRLKVKEFNLYFEGGPFASYFLKGVRIRRESWNTITYKDKINPDTKILGGVSIAVGYRAAIGKTLGLNFLLIENLNLLEFINSTLTFQIGINYHNKN